MLLSNDGKTVFVPHDRTMEGVDVETGKVVWTTQPKFPGRPIQLQETSTGLVIRGAAGEDSKTVQYYPQCRHRCRRMGRNHSKI